jgi:Fic family protein
MQVTEKKYLAEYQKLIGHKIGRLAQNFESNEQKPGLGYSTQSSAVYSANIEDNTVDLDSFMKHKLVQQKTRPPIEVTEIDHLIKAYEYAQINQLDETAFLECHALFSKTLLIKSQRGRYRIEHEQVFSHRGQVYLAVEPEYVAEKMQELFAGIDFLLNADLTEEEAFYHASLLHLMFAHIHPFLDGNGRGGRLLEKWFLCQILGEQFWKIPSEKYYKDHRDEYFQNINLGENYYQLNYDLCLPFLGMLPNCLA